MDFNLVREPARTLIYSRFVEQFKEFFHLRISDLDVIQQNIYARIAAKIVYLEEMAKNKRRTCVFRGKIWFLPLPHT